MPRFLDTISYYDGSGVLREVVPVDPQVSQVRQVIKQPWSAGSSLSITFDGNYVGGCYWYRNGDTTDFVQLATGSPSINVNCDDGEKGFVAFTGNGYITMNGAFTSSDKVYAIIGAIRPQMVAANAATYHLFATIFCGI